MLAVGRAVQLMVRLGRLKRAGKRYAYALRSISAGAAPRAGHTQSTPRIETETNRETTGAKYCIDAKTENLGEYTAPAFFFIILKQINQNCNRLHSAKQIDGLPLLK